MSPTDAFGNEIESGGAPRPVPVPASEPAPSRSPEASVDSMGAPTSRPPTARTPTPLVLPGYPSARRRSFFGMGLAAFLIFDAVVAGIVLAVVGLSSQATHVDGVSVPSPASSGDSSSATTTPPRGLRAGSMLRPDAVRATLAKAPAGALKLVRLAPASTDLQIATPAGGLKVVHISDGVTNVVTSPAGAGGLTTISRSRIDPGAPARIVRAAARRLNRSTTRIDYVVGLVFAGHLQWNAYFLGGRAAAGDAHGRFVRRIS